MDKSERVQLLLSDKRGGFASPLSPVEACREAVEFCSQPQQPLLVALPDSGFYSPGGDNDMSNRFDFVSQKVAAFTSTPIILPATAQSEGSYDVLRMKLDMSQGQLFRRRKRSSSQPPMADRGLLIAMQSNGSHYTCRSHSLINIHNCIDDWEEHSDGTLLGEGDASKGGNEVSETRCNDSRVQLEAVKGEPLRLSKRSRSQPPTEERRLRNVLHFGRSSSLGSIHHCAMVRGQMRTGGAFARTGNKSEAVTSVMAAAHLDPKQQQQQQWGNVGQTVVCSSDRANPLELPGVLDPEALNEAQLLGMRLRLVADQMEGDYRGRRRDRLEMERLEHAIMRVMYDLVTCRLF